MKRNRGGEMGWVGLKYIMGVALLLLGSVVPLCGQVGQGGAERIELDGILVTGARTKEDPERPNMSVIIPSALLQGPSSTLDSALRRQAGIDVQRPQEMGASLDDDSIRIRGFGARRIQVTVDGRSLNTPGTAGAYFIDWTTIPLTNVREIEVVKGVSDPRYGNVLGGVVNLVTRKPGKEPEIEAQVGAASFGTKRFDFFHGWKPGVFDYSVWGGYADSNGYLWNGESWMKNAGLAVGLDLPWKGRLLGDIQYVEVKKGFIVANRLNGDPDSPNYEVPKNHRYPASDGEIMYGGMGFRGQAEPGSWWRRERITYSIGYEQHFPKGLAGARFWQNHGDREAFNTRAVLNRVYHKEFYDDRSYGFDGNYRHETGNHVITVGLEYKRLKDDGDRNVSDDFRAPFRNGNYVNSVVQGLYVMDDISFPDKQVILTPGLRYMSYDGRAGPAGKAEGIQNITMDGLSPSLKGTYVYGKDGILYASVARALRMPTPPEHYWHYSPDAGVVTAALPFKKEDGFMVQAGWKALLPTGTKVEISPYYYRIRDYIQFDLINFVSYNIREATLYGVECGATQQITKGLSVFANYTYQKSKTRGDPFVSTYVDPLDRDFDEIPGLPEHKINGGIRYKGPGRETVALYGTYVSNQKVIYNNNALNPTANPTLRVRGQSSYVVVDLEATYPLAGNLEVTGYVRNLLDEKYQERFGFPAAEINVGLGLRVLF